MNSNPVSFIKVYSDIVNEFISTAQKRILYAKPSFIKNEIEAIINLKKSNNISIDIFMESGEDAIRHGLGETDALQLIFDNHEIFNIHTTNKIKIAILVVDNRFLVYMPELSFVEENYNDLAFP